MCFSTKAIAYNWHNNSEGNVLFDHEQEWEWSGNHCEPCNKKIGARFFFQKTEMQYPRVFQNGKHFRKIKLMMC